ncbi:hypothetical protein QBC34DRAFT_311616 [Podospora aff. communis PSN243]|uniref:Uncharacterized protein n=1 Tax=Podospora aff. communis PSN243 TaxID=3040156 RepID=A0AAV9G7T2_9PEZI|nr:hypothetical protein QBC34DRAFT_311616 [Podospora aff. communis PSN243]
MIPEDLVLQAGLVIISSALFVVIVLFTLTTTWAELSSNRQQALSWWVSADVGTTILVVRVLQGFLTATATAAICSSFTRLHWRLMSKDEGLKLSDLAAISPTTLYAGSVRLILSPDSGRSARLWAIGRLFLTALPWLGGILLFARTSLITVFDTAEVYDVTAGIGPFNASYVGPFIDFWQSDGSSVVPYSLYSVTHNLITNNLFSSVADPLECQRSERHLDCASYILSGGLSMVAPWTPPGNPDHQLVSIPEVPTVQAEFNGRSGPKSFQPDDCVLFGSNQTHIAAELCLALTDDNALHAGLFLCNGISSGKCITDTPQPNLTTTLTLHHRTATLLTSRSNLTILSLSNLSPPTLLPFNTSSLNAYRSALAWLLDYPQSGIPAPSSILEIFWSQQHNLHDPHADGVVLQNFRSLLAFPVWLFNANNYGNTEVKRDSVLNENLPEEFYATAAVVKPLVKLKFDPALLFTFVVLQAVVLVLLYGAVIWLFLPWGGRGERFVVTAFPVVDFLFGAEAKVREGEGTVRGAGSRDLVGRFGEVRVYTAGDGVRRRGKVGEDSS